MIKWFKKHISQMIACLCCVACMVGLLCFGAFAYQENDESYEGLTLYHYDIPFLSMEFHVAQDTANYGVYRVPLWLAEYRRYEFVIANGDAYRVQFEGDTNGYFVSPYGLNFEWRYTNREELSRDSTTIIYQYTQSLRLSGQSGYIVERTGQADEVYEGNFAIEWNVMVVTVEHNIATKYENVMSIAPYRSDYYMNEDYLYQRAPLRAVQLYYADRMESIVNNVHSLSFDFFLPSNAVGAAWNEQSALDLDFRFTPLLDMIDFTSSDLGGTSLAGARHSAWNFTYLKAVMEDTFYPYFDQGYFEGELVGYDNGYNSGYDRGWTKGYGEGTKTAEQGTIGNLFHTIVSSIYGVFADFLNFEIMWGEHFTFNVLGILGFIVSVLWLVVVLRVVIKFFL